MIVVTGVLCDSHTTSNPSNLSAGEVVFKSNYICTCFALAACSLYPHFYYVEIKTGLSGNLQYALLILISSYRL